MWCVCLQIVSALTSLIERTERDSHAVVVGGGYAGVELAAALTSKIRQLSRKKPPSDKSSISVTLVTDTDVILPFAPLSQRHAAELELKKDGINVRSGNVMDTSFQSDHCDVTSQGTMLSRYR